MGKHRGVVPPLRVRIDGIRLMYRPGADGAPGVFTCPNSLLAKLEKVFEEKHMVPVRGVMVTAEPDTVPGVLAALHFLAQRQVFIEEIPAEAEEWFALNRAKPASSVEAAAVVAAPAKGLRAKLDGLKRKKTAPTVDA